MRKQLQTVSGGICAPRGFLATGVHVEMSNVGPKNEAENIGCVLSGYYCTAACEFLQGSENNICGRINEKHLKMQYARGVFLNGEHAFNQPTDMRMLERICFEMGKGLQVPDEEILLVTCGKFGGSKTLNPIVFGVKTLFQTATATQIGAESAARVLSFAGKGQTVAYTFSLGNYSYTIGAIFGDETAATCILTTDVAISVEMLRKALSVCIKDTFALLQCRGIGSPNDVVCILASGAAGNYPIAQEDNEYEKFLSALESVLHEVCKAMAQGQGDKRVLNGVVQNAQSKRVSRAIAKSIANTQWIKEELRKGDFPLEGVIRAILSAGVKIDVYKLSVRIASTCGEFLLYDEGKAFGYELFVAKKIVNGDDLTICIDLKDGNYGSESYGNF